MGISNRKVPRELRPASSICGLLSVSCGRRDLRGFCKVHQLCRGLNENLQIGLLQVWANSGPQLVLKCESGTNEWSGLSVLLSQLMERENVSAAA